VTYSGGEDNRVMQIDFLCDPNIDQGQPLWNEEDPVHNYKFRWPTKYACPNKADGSLSGGSILLIM
jgi:hypothetical protein